jgi:hypothetical protein
MEKTHHSGNNKRAIGTFDINTKAATGAFYSCGIRIRLCHNFLQVPIALLLFPL